MDDYTRSEKIFNVRMAGRIQRLHTRPPNGEHQNVAAHTWGVVMILLDLFPDVSKEAIVYALRHDVPEIVTGDIPANVKWSSSTISEVVEEKERDFFRKMLWSYRVPDDTPYLARELLYIQLADKIELLFYCVEQMCLGNSLLIDVYENIEEKILETIDHLDTESIILEYINGYIQFLVEKYSSSDKLRRDGLSLVRNSMILGKKMS